MDVYIGVYVYIYIGIIDDLLYYYANYNSYDHCDLIQGSVVVPAAAVAAAGPALPPTSAMTYGNMGS